MRPLLAITGPTASGKSALALELAEELGGEILSCDSVQVYRGFEIGCAKPSAAERARVPHHLIDLVDWDEPFDARRFREAAVAAIQDVRSRGRVPILVGGTGLYLRALRWGLVEAPGPDPALRARLYAEERARPGALHARLVEVDPDTAATTPPGNLVRLVRALEISLLTGEPASRIRARHGFAREQVAMRIAAVDWPASTLRERIAERVDAMLAAGLLDEVRSLLARGVSPECRPMRAVGYKEASEAVLGLADERALGERIARATAAYARRQRTWLRRERGVTWIELGGERDVRERLRALAVAPET